jgi:hypothetical protein
MKRITNTIEIECENFSLDVKYWWIKGNAGDYYNPPQADEVDIKRVYINSYTTEDNDVIVINKRLLPASGNELPSSWEEIILEEISYDVESLM